MRILVCSDGSSASTEAVGFASLIRTPEEDSFTLLGIRADEEADPRLLEVLREQQAALRDTGRPVDLLTGAGEPVGAIEDAVERGSFDLVVVGGQRRGLRRLTTYGSATHRIVRSFLAPVLVVPAARETIRRIVIAVGGVGRIERAADFAGSIAAGVGARVTLLHVLSEPPVAYAPLVEHRIEPDAISERSDALSRLLRGLAARLTDRGVETDIRFQLGAVPQGIVRAVRDLDADLLVVGTSPAGGELRRYLLGDLAREFLRDAPCPILFVRTGTSLWRKVYGDFKGTIGLDR